MGHSSTSPSSRNIVKRIIRALQSAGLYRSWERCIHPHDYPRQAVTLEDCYGIRFVRQPWEHQPVRQLITHEADRPQFELMAWLIRPGDVVFDVGSHIGLFTVYASRLVDAPGKVYAFEPAPETYQRLRETLSLNGCENVIAQPKAISDQVGQQPMHLFAPTYSAWNSLGRPVMKTPDGRHTTPATTIDVATDTLDHFAERSAVSRINFLKVDVEGFEKHVFLGAKRLLRERRINYICFEISQAPLKGAGAAAREVFEVLESHGYRAWSFDGKNHRLDGPVRDSVQDWANYLAMWKDPAELS